MTRNGKIARLPLAIREQLNRRLRDGHKGTKLIPWLNGLPEVQAVLAAEFEGQPITPCNLYQWKKGGYRSWEQDQAKRDGLAAFVERAGALPGPAQDDLAERMSGVLTVNLALELQRLDELPDGPEKTQIWRELLGCLVLLRRGNFQGERLVVEREKLGFRRELHQRVIEDACWQWVQKPENRDRILHRLLTPEQKVEEIQRRNMEKDRLARQILGIN